MQMTRNQWTALNEAVLEKQIELNKRQGHPLTDDEIKQRRDYFENAAYTVEAVAAEIP